MGVVDACIAVALYVAAGGFFATGMFLLGKGKPKELGAMVLALALFQTITICFLISQGAALQAIMVTIFAYVWYVLAAALFLGTDLIILAHQLVIAGITYAAITAYLIPYPPRFFAVMTFSYTLIIFLLAAQNYLGAKAPKWLPKLNAWILIIESIATVLYPTLAITFNIPIP